MWRRAIRSKTCCLCNSSCKSIGMLAFVSWRGTWRGSIEDWYFGAISITGEAINCKWRGRHEEYPHCNVHAVAVERQLRGPWFRKQMQLVDLQHPLRRVIITTLCLLGSRVFIGECGRPHKCRTAYANSIGHGSTTSGFALGLKFKQVSERIKKGTRERERTRGENTVSIAFTLMISCRRSQN